MLTPSEIKDIRERVTGYALWRNERRAAGIPKQRLTVYDYDRAQPPTPLHRPEAIHDTISEESARA